MSRVAIATCQGDDVDIDSPVLLAACARGDLDASLVVWDDPSVDWSSFDLVVLRSTWDYSSRLDEFLAWARSVPTLVNPYEAVAYSTDKHYLGELIKAGFSVVPSAFCNVGETPVFPDGDFVVKPCVGAGSMEADRYASTEITRAIEHVARLHAMGRDAIIQPYVSAVDVIGERALIFINGSFSHAMTKGAMLNVTQLDRNALFRREQMSVATAEPEALALAEEILRHGNWDNLLYARVDLVHGENGWALMELELVEPSLFLSYNESAADNLVAAIKQRL
jgi:hypothetical protein